MNYTCYRCNTDFKDVFELYMHKDTHAPPKQVALQPQTDEQSNSIPTDLLMKKVFACSVCNKSYASHSGLKNHMVKMHPNKT